MPLVVWPRGEGETLPPNAAAVLLAAGGREPDLPAVLASVAVPADVPVYAVGATLAHRLVAQAVAAGAADYLLSPTIPMRCTMPFRLTATSIALSGLRQSFHSTRRKDEPPCRICRANRGPHAGRVQ